MSVAGYNGANSFVQSNPVTGNSDLIRIGVHCGPDTPAIQRPTYEMIRRSVPVHAAKTRLRFNSKIASFHVVGPKAHHSNFDDDQLM